MQTRWVGVVWAAAAAALLGVLVAAATSGSAPPAWILVLVVAIPTVVTLVDWILPRLREDGRATSHDRDPTPVPEPRRRAVRETEATSPGRVEPAGSVAPHRPVTGEDWDVVSEIVQTLGPRQLDWLRSTEFVTPWLDASARPARDLAPLVAAVADRPFDDELGRALAALTEAVDAFVDYYVASTFPDPLLLGEDWRFFEWDEAGATGATDAGDDLWAGRPARLRRLSSELATAYESFCAVAGRHSRVRKRVKTRA